MIQSIAIRGFQSHVDTQITFDEGLNVLTGATDSGKTSVIRAVRWVLYNEPSGESFINKAVGVAEVTLTNMSGDSVTKTRSKGKTSYAITLNGKTTTYEKTEPPTELAEMFGMEEAHFGDFTATLNFAYQLAPPFLISEPPSAGAKVLGKIAGSEVVDLAIKRSAKEVHRLRQEQSQAKKEQESLSMQLQEYEGLERIKNSLDMCDRALERVQADLDRNKKLALAKAAFDTATVALKTAQIQLDRFSDLPDIEEDLLDIKKSQERYDTLLRMFTRFEILSQKLSGYHEELKKYEKLIAASDTLQRVCDSHARYSCLQNLKEVYQKNTEKANAHRNTLEVTANVADSTEALRAVEVSRTRLTQLNMLRDNHGTYSLLATACQKRLSSLGGITTASKEIESIQDNSERLTAMCIRRKALNEKRFNALTSRKEVEFWAREKPAREQELNDLWSSLSVCPLCEQKIH